MSDLITVLRRIKAGESSFTPVDLSIDSLTKFQPIGKALAHAKNEGLVDRCEFKKESFKGDLYYSGAYIIGGLSFKGEEFLSRETTIKGWLSKCIPSVSQWVASIVSGVVIAALIYWLGLAP